MGKFEEDFLIKDFEQAYENLRATDNKRDVLVGFYITLVAAVGGFLLQGYSNVHHQLLILGLFFLWLVGFLIFGVSLSYRFWHDRWTLYANSIRRDILPDCSASDEWPCNTKYIQPRIWGTEFRILLLQAIVNSFVAAIFIAVNTGLNLLCRNVFLPLVLYSLIHIIGLIAWFITESIITNRIENPRHLCWIYLIPASIATYVITVSKWVWLRWLFLVVWIILIVVILINNWLKSKKEVIMREIIREIISAISVGLAFDAHFVIDTIIRKHSDDYLIFASNHGVSDNMTAQVHSKLSKIIANFEGDLIERMNVDDSYSYNIRGNASPCKLWRRK